jgi:hypothetical protein
MMGVSWKSLLFNNLEEWICGNVGYVWVSMIELWVHQFWGFGRHAPPETRMNTGLGARVHDDFTSLQIIACGKWVLNPSWGTGFRIRV